MKGKQCVDKYTNKFCIMCVKPLMKNIDGSVRVTRIGNVDSP